MVERFTRLQVSLTKNKDVGVDFWEILMPPSLKVRLRNL